MTGNVTPPRAGANGRIGKLRLECGFGLHQGCMIAAHQPAMTASAHPVLARLNAAALMILSLAQVAWLSVLIQRGYRWEIARCGRVPDDYYPELAWLLLLAPLVLPLLLSGVGFWLSGRTRRWTGLLMAPGWLALCGVIWATWMTTNGCAIAFER
ncbi:MAG: hypothetical protein KF842_05425 [Caulobacter sp.]|nr:hypothetical protein [Caulobacter sp.]